MRSRLLVLTAVLLSVLCVDAQRSKKAKSTPPPAPAAPSFELPPRATGSKDAPIVFEVFTDFECPGCRMLYLNSLRPMIDEYCAKGKVYLIHRDYPIPGHRFSRDAAIWADASAVVGKYEAVTEALYSKQESWVTSGKIEPIVSSVMSPAEFKRVQETVRDHKADIEADIAKDMSLAGSLQVKETPTIRVTNKGKEVEKHAGMTSYSILKRFIDQQLSK